MHFQIPTDVRKRLFRGFSATSLSPFATAVIQLGTVPLLIWAWGPAKYGDWLVLSAIPSYLTLADLGFGDASGSDMTARVAGGDSQGAIRTFQSSWMLLNILSAAAALVVGATVWWPPWKTWLHLATTTSAHASLALFLMSLYVVLSQQNGIFESGYRCSGSFARGIVFATLLRLTETSISCLVGVLTGNFVAVSATYLIIRVIGTIVYAMSLRKAAPWLTIGFKSATLQSAVELLPPALGFIAIPAANALSFQGSIIAVGSVLGPVAVTAFTSLRSLTRITPQLITALSNSLWPELSRAIGNRNMELARSLNRAIHQAALAIASSSGLLLWVLGPEVYRLWVRGAIQFNKTCFGVLIVAAMMNSLWTTSLTVAASHNQHCKLAFGYLVSTTIALLFGALLLHTFGIAVMAAVLLANDAIMGWIALATSLRQTKDHPAEFWSSVLSLSPAS